LSVPLATVLSVLLAIVLSVLLAIVLSVLLAIVLSVLLLITASDYPRGIFNFLTSISCQIVLQLSLLPPNINAHWIYWVKRNFALFFSALNLIVQERMYSHVLPWCIFLGSIVDNTLFISRRNSILHTELHISRSQHWIWHYIVEKGWCPHFIS
jgi:hypothetical protein